MVRILRRFFHPGGLRIRLAIMALLTLLPLVGLVLYNVREDRRQATRDAQEQALQAARFIAQEQANLIESSRQLLMTVSVLPEIREWEGDACSARLRAINQRDGRYANLGVISPDGRLVCSALPITGPINLGDRAYFRRALESRDFSVGEYQIGRATGRPTINFGYPVLDDTTGFSSAVVFAALDLQWVGNLAESLSLPPETRVTITDRNGVILTEYPDDGRRIGEKAPPESVLSRVVQIGGEGATEGKDIEGEEVLLVHTPLDRSGISGSTDVLLSMAIPKSVAFENANEDFRRGLLVVGFIGIVAAGAAWFGGHFLVIRPVSALRRAARRLHSGDMHTRTGLSYGGGELGEFARTFDDMAHAVQQRTEDLAKSYDTTLEGWARALELRDFETEGHSRRVTGLTLFLAKELSLPESDIDHIRRGAFLHDIGKMGIPDRVLLKPGPLTPEEWQIMRLHPSMAYELLTPIEFLRPALEIPYCHHEKWDGTGYPRGLKGEEIPLGARIFTVSDVWDALRFARPYREAWPEERVIAPIRSLSGIHFDPDMTKLFLDHIERFLAENPALYRR